MTEPLTFLLPPPLAPLVIGFRPFPIETAWAAEDRFHPALREENEAFPARNAFPRRAPFEEPRPCEHGPIWAFIGLR